MRLRRAERRAASRLKPWFRAGLIEAAISAGTDPDKREGLGGAAMAGIRAITRADPSRRSWAHRNAVIFYLQCRFSIARQENRMRSAEATRRAGQAA